MVGAVEDTCKLRSATWCYHRRDENIGLGRVHIDISHEFESFIIFTGIIPHCNEFLSRIDQVWSAGITCSSEDIRQGGAGYWCSRFVLPSQARIIIALIDRPLAIMFTNAPGKIRFCHLHLCGIQAGSSVAGCHIASLHVPETANDTAIIVSHQPAGIAVLSATHSADTVAVADNGRAAIRFIQSAQSADIIGVAATGYIATAVTIADTAITIISHQTADII